MPTELIQECAPDENSVGLVETKLTTLFEPPHPLVTASGRSIGPISVAYETYGDCRKLWARLIIRESG